MLELCKKEILIFFRSLSRIIGLLTFIVVCVLLSSVTLQQVGMNQVEISKVSSAVFWLVNAFSAVLALQYTASFESENNASVGVLLTGVSLEAYFCSKWLSSAFLLFILEVVCLVFSALFLQLKIELHWLPMLEICILASLGISGVGVLLSSMSATLAERDILLPVLLFPLILPILTSSAFMSELVVSGVGLDRFSFWYVLLVTSILMVASIGVLLYEQIIR